MATKTLLSAQQQLHDTVEAMKEHPTVSALTTTDIAGNVANGVFTGIVDVFPYDSNP